MKTWIEKIPDGEISGGVTEKSVEFAKRFAIYLGKSGDKIFTGELDWNGKEKVYEGQPLTSNQLRKFFGEVKRQQLSSFNKTDFIMLKPKLAYAVGRAFKDCGNKYHKIKDFYYVISDAIDCVKDEKSFDNFITVFEAIVAYHKAAEVGQLEL